MHFVILLFSPPKSEERTFINMNIDINQYQQLLIISKELLIQADIDHVLTISMDRLIEISGCRTGNHHLI